MCPRAQDRGPPILSPHPSAPHPTKLSVATGILVATLHVRSEETDIWMLNHNTQLLCAQETHPTNHSLATSNR
eukprot:12895786-Prorocentrum_lima.AAC.1